MSRFAAPIFLSAFLLFLVQPMMGKYILPWFGGSAGVWSVCLLFFQAMLVVGYAYAHALHRYCSTRAQMIVHLTLLAASLMFLPITPGIMWKPGPADHPVTPDSPVADSSARAAILHALFNRPSTADMVRPRVSAAFSISSVRAFKCGFAAGACCISIRG
jgi:hypothetical protein